MNSSMMVEKGSDFELLVNHIQMTSDILQQDVRLVINRSVTTKAWLTGLYIIEYEQHGNDRAKYGEGLLQNVSKRLGGHSYSVTNLRSYRLFYSLYPDLRPVIAAYLSVRFGIGEAGQDKLSFLPDAIRQSMTAELTATGKRQSVTADSNMGRKW